MMLNELILEYVEAYEPRTKKCCHCKTPRHISQYGKDMSTQDKKNARCNRCQEEVQEAYRARKQEEIDQDRLDSITKLY